jgi:hypothetical protein
MSSPCPQTLLALRTKRLRVHARISCCTNLCTCPSWLMIPYSDQSRTFQSMAGERMDLHRRMPSLSLTPSTLSLTQTTMLSSLTPCGSEICLELITLRMYPWISRSWISIRIFMSKSIRQSTLRGPGGSPTPGTWEVIHLNRVEPEKIPVENIIVAKLRFALAIR